MDPTRTSSPWAGRPRALHLIDLENLLGSERSPEAMVEVWSTYRAGIGIRPGDHAVIASGPSCAKVALFLTSAPDLQWRVRAGEGGPSGALLDFVDLDHIAHRFQTLVIASGHHVFTPLALQARVRGLHLWQVLGRGAAARSLMRACPLRSRLRLDGGARRPVAAPDSSSNSGIWFLG